MSTNIRLPQRRIIGQRAKADENAPSRHVRQSSHTNNIAASRFPAKENALKVGGAQRIALGEVTSTAVNRIADPPVAAKPGFGKGKEEVGSKRPRSGSVNLPPQRVPLGPGRVQVAPPVTNAVHARAPIRVKTHPIPAAAVVAPRRASRIVNEAIQEEIDVREDHDQEMDVEDERSLEDDELFVNEREVQQMVGVESDEDEEAVPAAVPAYASAAKPPRVWPDFPTAQARRFDREIQKVREHFQDEVDMFDTTMVSEYCDEIFEYMCELEDEVMPNPNYMDGQNEINWSMRQTLVDWLLQVHLRYHMLPETLWIAVNIVDRFLTKRVVSLMKLQLVGVTAMFIAAKYEEILAPSVQEFVFMTENGYSKEEILKGERIMLQTLDFKVSHYCSPYSWMRKISKADDYDIQTRTLSKFLTEVTLLDYRFLRVKPSIVAAVGMYTARRMLGGDWNDAFVFYSGYTEEQLLPGHNLLVEKLVEENFSRQYVCKKYANKKFLKASVFAIEWAKQHIHEALHAESMNLAD